MSNSNIYNNQSTYCPLPYVRVQDFQIGEYIIWVICALGVIGNIFTLAVLRRHRVMTSYTFLLRVLALADASFLVSVLAIRIINREWIRNSLNYKFCKWDDSNLLNLQTFTSCMLAVSQGTSNWTLVVLAFNRYFAICRPFSKINLKSITLARSASVGLVLFFVVIETSTAVINRQNFQPRQLIAIVVELTTRVLRNMCPFVMLIFLNTRLLVAILAKKPLVGTRSRLKRDDFNLQMTRNLIGVLVLFFVCIPTNDVLLLIKLFGVREKIKNLRRLHIIADMLVIINSSMNFFIYCIFTEQFRETVKSMCPCFESSGGMKENQRKRNAGTEITPL